MLGFKPNKKSRNVTLMLYLFYNYSIIKILYHKELIINILLTNFDIKSVLKYLIKLIIAFGFDCFEIVCINFFHALGSIDSYSSIFTAF